MCAACIVATADCKSATVGDLMIWQDNDLAGREEVALLPFYRSTHFIR